MDGRYYWLKLKKDFFKRHDIRILEAMPDGHMSVLFYLKLMLESVDHEGELRFSEKTAYSPEMLATITDTDIEIVKTSLERLSELGLIKITRNGTIVIEKLKSMVGFETKWAEKKRAWREEQKNANEDNVLDMSSTCPQSVLTMSDKSKSKSKSKSKRQSKNNIYIFVPPTVEEVYQYCESRHNVIDAQLFVDYYQSKNWMVSSGCQMTDWRAAVRAWENNEINYKRGD